MMTANALDKLSKVLALADSAQDGEAMAALRAARKLLHHDGINLSDILQSALAQKRLEKTNLLQNEFVTVRGGAAAILQREVLHLQAQLRDCKNQLQEKKSEAQHWRAIAEAKTRQLSKAHAERDHWYALARQAANTLWDVGKRIKS
jgi:flagellar biosynthesis chaperone FliJ